jgi:hypothetical protein
LLSFPRRKRDGSGGAIYVLNAAWYKKLEENMKKILAFLLTLLFAATGNAGLRDRLEPILSGDLNIAVDTFIIGTHDKYVVTIVRDIDYEVIRDLSTTMTEMINNYENDKLAIIEKQVIDKNSKKFSLAERTLTIKSDLQIVLASEPLINSDMEEIELGSLQELIWNKVAGPNGLGAKILSDYPEPVNLSRDKSPVDTKRYVDIFRNDIGGIFLDSESMKMTDVGCSALIVEAFNFDAEVHYGGMVTQYAYQPYVDASYAVTNTEFSFEKKAYRQLRFTVFSRDGKVLYSVKMPDTMWITEDLEQNAPFMLYFISRNRPHDISELLSEDVKTFDEYVRERIESARKMQQELQEPQEPQESQEFQELPDNPKDDIKQTPDGAKDNPSDGR